MPSSSGRATPRIGLLSLAAALASSVAGAGLLPAGQDQGRPFGPPRYRDAKFDYPGGLLELEAEMRYLRGRKGDD